MNLSLIALAIFAIAIMVVGLLEHTKGWWKNIPAWFPSVASPVLNLALGQLVAPLVLVGVAASWAWGIVIGLLALAVTEFCYQLIIQSIPQVLSGLVAKVAPPPAEPSPVPPATVRPAP